MAFLNACREMRIAHVPARDDAAVSIFRCVGIFIPWIFAFIAMRTQIGIVGKISCDNLIWMFAIIVFPGLKSALRNQHPDFCFARETQTSHAIRVAAKMCLARDRNTHAVRAQIIAERQFTDWQGHEIPSGPM